MPERLQRIKVSVEIDTDKRTIEHEFDVRMFFDVDATLENVKEFISEHRALIDAT
mgnify:CR=1 FL=1